MKPYPNANGGARQRTTDVPFLEIAVLRGWGNGRHDLQGTGTLNAESGINKIDPLVKIGRTIAASRLVAGESRVVEAES